MAREGGKKTGRRRSASGHGKLIRLDERAQEDPQPILGGQASRVPSAGAVESSSGDEPQELVSHSSPNYSQELTSYKGIALKNIGKGRDGKIIPHKRSEKIAKQIVRWVAGGFNVNDMAVRLNVRPGHLRQHYYKELQTGETRVHMDVHDHLLQRVKKSDRMAVFYAKARMGYRDGDVKPIDTGLLAIHIHQ